VLATLIDGGTSKASVSSKTLESLRPSTLILVDQVVSASLLKNRLTGIQVLEIAKSAVVTPAARDYIRECKVEIVRSENHSSNASEARADFKAVSARVSGSGSTEIARPQRLIIAGTVAWLPAVAKQLCSKQAKVCSASIDATAALRTVAEGIRAGHQAAVMLVQSAHATCWQAARDDSLRPAVVSNWTELNDVLREVPANVLILSAKAWNLPSSCNTARRFFQHLQNQS
jgi:hypothetical protein